MLSGIATEARNPETTNLDTYSAYEIAQAMNREDGRVPIAIEKALPEIARAISMVEEVFLSGGRLFYIGAGTSGRLGVLDASECPPTFGVPRDMVIGIIAGGDSAIRTPAEGAEDNFALAEKDLTEHALCARDCVIGIAASGRTPYVLGGLKYAKSIGCKTGAISCSPNSAIGAVVDIAIEVSLGAEVLTGSTRLKAGTAQKCILNMISTGAMVRIGKCYQNLMVDVVQSNEKLRARAEGIVMEATGADRETARKALDAADGHAKTAIVMLLTNTSFEEAKALLEAANGRVRGAIGE
ncbi:MAG: N-acetylmuramic acid 6-phosphate etherase [Christensenellales bacterium]